MTKEERDKLRRLLADYGPAAAGLAYEHVAELLDAADRLDELVETLPRCGHVGCPNTATRDNEAGSLLCDGHVNVGTDLPWAPVVRRLEEK